MIQDADGGRPILEAEVTVQLQEQGTDRSPIITQATRQNATNKLLYAALVNLPAPGLWELQVTAQYQAQRANVTGMVTAVPPRPTLCSWWLYAALLSVTIGSVALHQWHRRHRG